VSSRELISVAGLRQLAGSLRGKTLTAAGGLFTAQGLVRETVPTPAVVPRKSEEGEGSINSTASGGNAKVGVGAAATETVVLRVI